MSNKKVKILILLTLLLMGLMGCFKKEENSKTIAIINISKTEYYVGENLDLSTINIKTVDNDGKEKSIIVEKEMISGFDSSKIGDETIFVTVNGQVTNFIIKILDIELENLTIKKLPNKVAYYLNENLDLSGLIVKGYYNNNTNRILTDEEIKNNIVGFNPNLVGEQTLVIKIGEITDDFEIWVKELERIYIDSDPIKTIYYQGEKFDSKGLLIILEFSDGSTITREIIESDIIDSINTEQIGEQTLQINIKGKTATFNIELKGENAVVLNNIEILNKDNYNNINCLYNSTNSLNLDNMRVLAEYSDGTEEIFTIIKEGTKYIGTSDRNKDDDDNFIKKEFEINGFNTSIVGEQIITIILGIASDTIEIIISNLVEIEVTDIELNNPQTIYQIDEEFSVTGMTITVYYSDNTERIFSLEEKEDTNFFYILIDGKENYLNITGFDSSEVGESTITILYKEKSDNFEVNIIAEELNKIEVITEPSKTDYIFGEDTKLDISDLQIEAYYELGTNTFSKLYTIEQEGDQYILKLNDKKEGTVTLTGYDLEQLGDQYVTITLGSKTDTFKIKVVGISRISLEDNTVKKEYYYTTGETSEVDTLGLLITLNYTNGTSSTFTLTDFLKIKGSSITETINNEEGMTQEISVMAQGEKDSYNVTTHKLKATEIQILPSYKYTYFIGEPLDLTGLEIKMMYNDGSYILGGYHTPEEANYNELWNKNNNGTYFLISNSLVKGFDSTEVNNNCELTLLINGLSTKFNVEITDMVPTSITIDTTNVKKTFIKGEDFSYSGLEVTGHFEKTEFDIFPTDSHIEFSGYDKDDVRTQNIIVTYTYNDLSFSKEYTVEVVGK